MGLIQSKFFRGRLEYSVHQSNQIYTDALLWNVDTKPNRRGTDGKMGDKSVESNMWGCKYGRPMEKEKKERAGRVVPYNVGYREYDGSDTLKD